MLVSLALVLQLACAPAAHAEGAPVGTLPAVPALSLGTHDATHSTCSADGPRCPQPARFWRVHPGLATGLATFPGFLVHGAGAFAIGDRSTARKLVLSEVGGLGTFLAAGTLIAVTGTSRRLIGLLAPITIAGFGVFVLGFLADLYAASTGGRPDHHAPEFVPRVDAELGYLHVYDPQFAYRSFVTARSDVRSGALRVSPEAQIALDDDTQRFLLEFAYRPLGRTVRRSARDGSFLDLATGLRYQRYGSDGFAVMTPEWHLQGRIDLGRVGPSLAGSYFEGQIGAGLELYDFEVKGSRIRNNATGLLLARFGFGMYFGTGGANSGEAYLYYDHRHDDFAAGFGVPGIPAGILGHIGLRGHYFITRRWGIAGLMEVGSALVTGLSLRYRHAPALTSGGAG